MNKVVRILAFLFFLSVVCIATAQKPTCYRIYLTDKANSPFTVDNPSAFLSQRAIDKRTRFSIPITEQDFPVNPNYVSQIKNVDDSIQILSTSKWMNTVTIYCPDSSKILHLQGFDFVGDILPVASYRLLAPTELAIQDVGSGADAVFSQTNQKSVDYGIGDSQIRFNNGQYLHDAGFRGEGMLIAVIDGGWYGVESCEFYNNMLSENRFAGKFSLMPHFVDTLENPYSELHGTIVTSVMAADEPGSLVGTAPKASYAFIHSEYVATEELIEEDFWARAAEIADSIGADVVNSSLGYTTYDDFPQANTDYSTFDGQHSIASLCATILAHKGVIVCVAVGNDGANEWHHIGKPSDAFDILSVGACRSDSTIAIFSSCGYTSDGRVKPDVCAVGVNTGCVYPFNNYNFTNGTSLATPVISGLCACLWQALPEYSALDIMQKIREGSSQFGTPDSVYGYGIPDFYAVYKQYLGVGIHSHSLSVFPNPTDGIFNIQLAKDVEISNIMVYDLQGRVVVVNKKSETPNSASLNIGFLPAGIYILQVSDSNRNQYHYKIVKR